jgi:DNA-binding NtrC family response regulator
MTTAKTKSVWLVNDEEYVRKAFCIMLEHGIPNIKLTRFEWSVQAWEALAQDKPDLLVMGDAMIQMRGKDIAEQLFARGDNFPIIVTSAWEGTKEWVDALTAKGMKIQFLSLPFDPTTLWDATRSALSLSPRPNAST